MARCAAPPARLATRSTTGTRSFGTLRSACRRVLWLVGGAAVCLRRWGGLVQPELSSVLGVAAVGLVPLWRPRPRRRLSPSLGREVSRGATTGRQTSTTTVRSRTTTPLSFESRSWSGTFPRLRLLPSGLRRHRRQTPRCTPRLRRGGQATCLRCRPFLQRRRPRTTDQHRADSVGNCARRSQTCAPTSSTSARSCSAQALRLNPRRRRLLLPCPTPSAPSPWTSRSTSVQERAARRTAPRTP